MSKAVSPLDDTEHTPAVALQAAVSPRINIAFQQNSVPVIAEIVLTNATDDVLSDVTVSVTAVPPFLREARLRLEALNPGTTERIAPVPVALDPAYLLRLTEALRGEIRFVAANRDGEIARLTKACEVLSPAQWSGLASAPELIAAFVRPNDPAIDGLLRRAAEKLRRAGRDPSFDGYRAGKKARAWELADALWAALCDLQITYALPPRSFEQDGQKVRGPSVVCERRVATCLDLALVFAAALEQAGLNPVVGLSEGHAFAGLWLTEEGLASAVVDEPQILRKRIQLDELILCETTLLTRRPAASFRAAIQQAAKLVDEDADKRFEAAIDIRQARLRQIRPLDLDPHEPSPPGPEPDVDQAAALEPTPPFAEDPRPAAQPADVSDRLERWKRRLLDLSLRNRLLNFKPTHGAVRLLCPDPDGLMRQLAKAAAITLLPAAPSAREADPHERALPIATGAEDPDEAYASAMLQRNALATDLEADELEARLTMIYRAARTSLEEGGANSLFVVAGFVSWTPREKQQAYKAPLLLVPVTLERKSVRSGFRLLPYDDEPRINPTLLEMMRQDFGLAIPEFSQQLPAIADGIEVSRIWRTARLGVKDVRGFEVTDAVFLTTLSFTKYLMWKDLVARADVLKRNPVVKHLIDTPKESYGAALPEEDRLDDEVHRKDLALPLPADSSQTAAVLAASRGDDFVLFGPPGTGKSQTIANMIAQLLWQRRTVLFVSAKTTALAVVRHRLDEIGLGSFCLEVHSAKAQKRAVLHQLGVAWDARNDATDDAWDAATADSEALRDRLNGVVAALHRRHANGLTVYRAMGEVIANRRFLPELRISLGSPDQQDEAAIAQLYRLCDTIAVAYEGVSETARRAFTGITKTRWSPSWQREFSASARAFAERGMALRDAVSALFALFHLPPCGDPRRVQRLLVLAAQILKPEAGAAAAFLGSEGEELATAFRAWKAERTRYAERTSHLAGAYEDGVFALDLAALQKEWHDACAASIFTRGKHKGRVARALLPYTRRALPRDLGSELASLVALKEARETMAERAGPLSALRPAWHGPETDVEAIEVLWRWAADTRAAIQALATAESPDSSWISSLAPFLPEGEKGDPAARRDLGAAAARSAAASEAFETERARLAACVEASDPWLGRPPGEGWLTDAIARAQAWHAHAGTLPHWCKWQESVAAAKDAGLGPLIDALGKGELAPDALGRAFRIGYARWWVDQVVEREEVLRGFIAEQHEHQIERFAALDLRIADLAKAVIGRRLAADVPPRGRFGKDPEFGLLAREIQKKARHLPLRQLFAQIPHALAALAPCMMMSPLSVAQYLPADARPFDAVIFDEASQLPVWDAIGPIARARQTIIVGDPKQLPPTTFFERAADDYDETSDLEDLDSILDECIAANLPSKRLSWHYRSRHESLIAFSNQRYYAGRLVTFPSPVTEDRAVHTVAVPDGVYERGHARINRREAEEIVRDTIRRLTATALPEPLGSLGIVTMNTEQQHLIETMLDQERRKDSGLDRFFGTECREPVFVKNLESVQGDERDVILFSVTYGKDESGRVSHNFGPLNKDSGTRRLNVAITRARTELAVFSSLDPDLIDLSRTKAIGARDLKHFLEYARRGARALAEAAAPTGGATESPFEDAVRAALEESGWTVHPQVGVAGFRIDLGVVHPEAPGRYLAGVECDGATYHRSATARDRDILRERVLRGLGWHIHRVWSTDWWMDADRALENLTHALEEDLANAREPRPGAGTGGRASC